MNTQVVNYEQIVIITNGVRSLGGTRDEQKGSTPTFQDVQHP